MDTREVWASIGGEDRVCSMGEKHHVTLYARKVLGPVVDRREHDNGYEKRITEVREDRQGRKYHQHITIDFSNNVYWVRDVDKTLFKNRLPSNGIDITKDKRCEN